MDLILGREGPVGAVCFSKCGTSKAMPLSFYLVLCGIRKALQVIVKSESYAFPGEAVILE